MALVRMQKGVGDQGVEERPVDLDSMIEQNGQIVFQVMTNFLCGSGQDRAEDFQGFLVGESCVKSGAFFPAE